MRYSSGSSEVYGMIIAKRLISKEKSVVTWPIALLFGFTECCLWEKELEDLLQHRLNRQLLANIN